MKPIKNVGKFYDFEIPTGANWRKDILAAIGNCDLGVILLSHDFLASEFIIQEELPGLLQQAEDKGVLIAILFEGECLYEEYGLDEIQFINPVDKPLNDISNGKRLFYYKKLGELIKSHFNI